jgi:hypothetical protein
MELGILVVADNHFIVRGPCPTPEQARDLARRWTMIQIGSNIRATDPYGPWQVSTKEVRENLTWAVIVEGPPAEPVRQLLAELEARGVSIETLGPKNLNTA